MNVEIKNQGKNHSNKVDADPNGRINGASNDNNNIDNNIPVENQSDKVVL